MVILAGIGLLVVVTLLVRVVHAGLLGYFGAKRMFEKKEPLTGDGWERVEAGVRAFARSESAFTMLILRKPDVTIGLILHRNPAGPTLQWYSVKKYPPVLLLNDLKKAHELVPGAIDPPRLEDGKAVARPIDPDLLLDVVRVLFTGRPAMTSEKGLEMTFVEDGIGKTP